MEPAGQCREVHAAGGNGIALTRNDSQVSVEITDDGEGMDPLFLPQIFDRFRRADASSSRRHGGPGLGLSIVRQLTELHGGNVSAHSAGPGGAHFRLGVPGGGVGCHAAGSQWPLATLEQPVEPAQDKAPVVLNGVREDPGGGRRTGFTRAGGTPAAGLRRQRGDRRVGGRRHLALMREVPHVIVSDIGMPGTDGYTLMRQIRALHDASAGVPAIALTAYVRSEDRARAARGLRGPSSEAHGCRGAAEHGGKTGPPQRAQRGLNRDEAPCQRGVRTRLRTVKATPFHLPLESSPPRRRRLVVRSPMVPPKPAPPVGGPLSFSLVVSVRDARRSC